jgi:hypothetical protein
MVLLFKPEHVNPIDIELKTETRRMWSKRRVKIGSIHKAKTKMLSKNYFALLQVVNVYQEKLRSITAEGARAEGGYTVESYIDKFYEINPQLDRKDFPFVWVWVVKFKKVGLGNLPADSIEFKEKVKEILSCSNCNIAFPELPVVKGLSCCQCGKELTAVRVLTKKERAKI